MTDAKPYPEAVMRLVVIDQVGMIWGEARCDGCKHWDPEDAPDQNRRCLRIPHASKATAADRAHVSDAEGWSATLWTDAGFGCAAHEPLELAEIERRLAQMIPKATPKVTPKVTP